MKRILLLVLTTFAGAAFVAAGCNNGSLLSSTDSSLPPEGKLFAHVVLETVQDPSEGFMGGKDRTNDVEDVYEIRLDAVSLDVGGVSFAADLPEAALAVAKSHEDHDHGEEAADDSGGSEDEHHEEPSSCDFDGSFSSTATADLLDSVALPCFVADEGTYAGLNATLGSLAMTGTASRDGTTYAFEVRGGTARSVVVPAEAPLALGTDIHHVTVLIDIKSWFHGVDFSQLESADGVILLDEAHNTHRFEHMVQDHLPASMSLSIED